MSEFSEMHELVSKMEGGGHVRVSTWLQGLDRTRSQRVPEGQWTGDKRSLREDARNLTSFQDRF